MARSLELQIENHPRGHRRERSELEGVAAGGSSPAAHSRVGKQRLRVLIADRDGLAARMICSAMHAIDRVAIVVCAADQREALDLARYYQPSVVVLNTGLPPRGGAPLIAALSRIAPDAKVVTVSIDDDWAAIAALRAGAVGHIDKETDPEELARQVIRAADGEAVLPQRLILPLLELLRKTPDSGWRPLQSRLTTREWEIMELLGQGESTHEIADRLVLAPSTVYSHIKSSMRKLQVHTRRDAVAAAERLRIEEALTRNRPLGRNHPQGGW